MLRHDAELGQLSNVSDVDHANLTQEVFGLAPLQAAELVVKIAGECLRHVWQVATERCDKSSVQWE